MINNFDGMTKEIDNIKFKIIKFPARYTIKLEKRTLKYLLPILDLIPKDKEATIENLQSDKFINSVRETLNNLGDDEFEDYIFKMIESTYVELNSDSKMIETRLAVKETFDIVFSGKTVILYKLLFEIMKVNSFAFFELVGGSGLKIDL